MPAVTSMAGLFRAVLRTASAGGPGTPGWLGVPRLLAVTAVTAVWVARRPDDAAVWVLAAVLLLGTAVEPVLRRLLPDPVAVHLPGWRAPTVSAARFVVPAALGALAARREVSVDRLSDTMLLSDAISAGAPHGFADGHVSLSIADVDDRVELSVGPMQGGAAERLRATLDLPDLGSSLVSLADEVRIEQGDEGEFLVVAISSLAA